MVVGSRGKALNPFKYSDSWLAGRLGVNIVWNGTTNRQGATLWLNPKFRARLILEALSSMRVTHNCSISSENFCPWLIMLRMFDLLFNSWFVSVYWLMNVPFSLKHTMILCRQLTPLEARSLEEDLTTARTVHKPCWGKELTALVTIFVTKSYTVQFGWQIRATTWGSIVNNWCY